jgi:hypothetical protein
MMELRKQLAAAQARIEELREALSVLAHCAIDAIETDCDIDEIINRFNTSINGAMKERDDLSALEEAKRQARREALMEAAGFLNIQRPVPDLSYYSELIRRMAEEVK